MWYKPVSKLLIAFSLFLSVGAFSSCIGFLGSRISPKSEYYRSLPFGICFASFNEASTDKWLSDVDRGTFEVLDELTARDKNHVWYAGVEMMQVDAQTFRIDNGVYKDKHHVYWKDPESGDWSPMTCGIDVVSAELLHGSVVKDKAHVYIRNFRAEVDRETFHLVPGTSHNMLFADKDYIYTTYNWDIPEYRNRFRPIAIPKMPLEVYSDSYYIRNGGDFIFFESTVFLRDVEVRYVRVIAWDMIAINDTVYKGVKPFLPGVADVATFEYLGGFTKDRNHVYYGDSIIAWLDPATFHETGTITYEDKMYRLEFQPLNFPRSFPYEVKKRR